MPYIVLDRINFDTYKQFKTGFSYLKTTTTKFLVSRSVYFSVESHIKKIKKKKNSLEMWPQVIKLPKKDC